VQLEENKKKEYFRGVGGTLRCAAKLNSNHVKDETLRGLMSTGDALGDPPSSLQYDE
jgi:hypothetical protein